MMKLKDIYLYFLCCVRRNLSLYSKALTIRRFDETLMQENHM